MTKQFKSLLVLTAFSLAAIQGARAETNIPAKPANTKDGQPYSVPTGKTHPIRVFWGDAHLHTQFSFDAGLMGTRLTPEDAFRFARGEEVVSTTGLPSKLKRPYDFLVVTDHSDYDYERIVRESKLVVDTRKATGGIESPKIVHC